MTLSRESDSPDPVCMVEARYWRSGLRWEIVLQIMYYMDRHRGRGQGPFFVIGRTWRETTAQARTDVANGRLAGSEQVIRHELERSLGGDSTA